MAVCRVCDKKIRGNAGSEEWDDTAQATKFVCKACTKKFDVSKEKKADVKKNEEMTTMPCSACGVEMVTMSQAKNYPQVCNKCAAKERAKDNPDVGYSREDFEKASVIEFVGMMEDEPYCTGECGNLKWGGHGEPTHDEKRCPNPDPLVYDKAKHDKDRNESYDFAATKNLAKVFIGSGTPKAQFNCPLCGVMIGANLKGDSPYPLGYMHMKQEHSAQAAAVLAGQVEPLPGSAADGIKFFEDEDEMGQSAGTGPLGQSGRRPEPTTELVPKPEPKPDDVNTQGVDLDKTLGIKGKNEAALQEENCVKCNKRLPPSKGKAKMYCDKCAKSMDEAFEKLTEAPSFHDAHRSGNTGKYNYTKCAKVGRWEVHIDPVEHYGWFERETDGLGGGLWFQGGKLSDYDGVYSLPKDVAKAIQQCGFGFDGPVADFTGESKRKLKESACDAQHDASNSWWEYDAQGIPLCRVCDKCEKEKLSHYRPEILQGYDQSDVDEPIDPEDYHGEFGGEAKYRLAGVLREADSGDDFQTTKEKYANEHPCSQCGKPNYSWIIGDPCDSCTRKNHRKAMGKSEAAQFVSEAEGLMYGWTKAELDNCKVCGKPMTVSSPNGVDHIYDCDDANHPRLLVSPNGEVTTMRPRGEAIEESEGYNDYASARTGAQAMADRLGMDVLIMKTAFGDFSVALAHDPSDYAKYEIVKPSGKFEADEYGLGVGKLNAPCDRCGEPTGHPYYGGAICKNCAVRVCPDCGEPGEIRGHMGCQYPSDEPDPGHDEPSYGEAVDDRPIPIGRRCELCRKPIGQGSSSLCKQCQEKEVKSGFGEAVDFVHEAEINAYKDTEGKDTRFDLDSDFDGAAMIWGTGPSGVRVRRVGLQYEAVISQNLCKNCYEKAVTQTVVLPGSKEGTGFCDDCAQIMRATDPKKEAEVTRPKLPPGKKPAIGFDKEPDDIREPHDAVLCPLGGCPYCSMPQSSWEKGEGKAADHKARMDALHADAQAVVATGKCPDCGSPLVRNNSLSGWWQCAGVASPGFRKSGYENLPSCSFQTFTEDRIVFCKTCGHAEKFHLPAGCIGCKSQNKQDLLGQVCNVFVPDSATVLNVEGHYVPTGVAAKRPCNKCDHPNHGGKCSQDDCACLGESIREMLGEQVGIVKQVHGKRGLFCCQGCADGFQADLEHGVVYPALHGEGGQYSQLSASLKYGFCAACGQGKPLEPPAGYTDLTPEWPGEGRLKEEYSAAEEEDILYAADRLLGSRSGFQVDFEHGQYWLTDRNSGAQWSVNQAEGPGTSGGYDFEEVTPPMEAKVREVFAADPDDDYAPTCGLCGGDLVPLGQLGKLMHYRCRDCGMESSQEMESKIKEGDGNDKLCSCGHVLEDHEEYIDGACTADGCACLNFQEPSMS